MTLKEFAPIPSLSQIDRKDKMMLWLATEVLEQGEWNVEEFYDLLESHFALISRFRTLTVTITPTELTSSEVDATPQTQTKGE